VSIKIRRRIVLIAFRFFYKRITLTALGFGLAALSYVAMTQDVLEEGRDKRRVYVRMMWDRM